MPWIYILYSEKKDRYYIGSTENITRRLAEHDRGHTKWTRFGAPWQLMALQEVLTLGEARSGERYLKKLKSRRILQTIIQSGIGIRIPTLRRDGSNPVEV